MKNEETKEKVTKKGATTKEKTTKKSEAPKKKQTTKTTTKKKSDTKKVAPKGEEKIIEERTEEKIVNETIEKKDTKKKISGDVFLILGLVIVVILGCVLMQGEKPEPTYELPLTLSGEAGLQQLTYQEYQEKIDNDEQFVVILERATCSHCVSFMPVAEGVAKENGVPMYYVDTDTFTEEDWATFETSNSYLKKNSGNWGTPTTLVQAGSETVGYVEGETSADSLLELYNKYFDMDEE